MIYEGEKMLIYEKVRECQRLLSRLGGILDGGKGSLHSLPIILLAILGGKCRRTRVGDYQGEEPLSVAPVGRTPKLAVVRRGWEQTYSNVGAGGCFLVPRR